MWLRIQSQGRESRPENSRFLPSQASKKCLLLLSGKEFEEPGHREEQRLWVSVVRELGCPTPQNEYFNEN